MPGTDGENGGQGEDGAPGATGAEGLPGVAGVTGAPGAPGSDGLPGNSSYAGSVYTRWGRTVCEGDAVVLYQGEKLYSTGLYPSILLPGPPPG